ncbi:FAD-dependent monooxygenase (plasmid) [Rhodococcus pseudokoreensis]|uniref:FAD-dependent monooxygenase n=1 Tax=Rhodococcus pseudokoreensis TaxID=2811421 RepID=A0A974ZRG9_9NOCA|nr:FAD-dependent monooxygenase [Rhodococcus pseudokoreensis]QSE87656.1 FAD-dependent monooxygenase [Rhodococcus pseudokoreensis]
MPLKVIVSGAGVAGLSLAHWLARIGATPIVVERAPHVQTLGHYISLKGNGVEMVRRMGIFDACEARSAQLEEVRLYCAASGRLLRSEHTATLAKTLGGYILFRRADLQAALYDLSAEHTDIRFGVQIVEAHADTGHVEVTLSDGTTERADLLVGADGIHSAVRGLAFGPDFERPLGGYYITITQTLHHGLAPVVHSYLSTGRMVNLLPVTPDTASAVVYLGADVDAPPRNDAVAMRDYLLATCADFPDDVHNVLGSVGADDFVFSDAIAQIDMPRITRGRVALIGDAAHCPTFLSGMGSSLALQDAHMLAGSIARSPDDLDTSLARYEEVMAPIACRYRDSGVRAHAAFLTSSRVKARIRDLALRLTPERVFERGVRRFFDSERPLADLPST